MVYKKTMKQKMKKIYQTKILFNALLYGVCGLVAMGLIQHATFFYSFPPNMDKWVQVSAMTYLTLTIFLFISAKALHILEKKSNVIG